MIDDRPAADRPVELSRERTFTSHACFSRQPGSGQGGAQGALPPRARQADQERDKRLDTQRHGRGLHAYRAMGVPYIDTADVSAAVVF